MSEAKAFLEGFANLQGMQIYGKDKVCLVSTVKVVSLMRISEKKIEILDLNNRH